jgi:hypothetical protein
VGPLADVPDTGTDFEELAILRLRLSGELRQVAEASRWLDAEDRTVLALWWQEAAGVIDHGEIAAALKTTPAYAAVRIQRMRAQLDRSRLPVAALEARPRCPGLAETAAGWDQRPGALWRKRIDRHVRDCALCLGASRGGVAVERLLVGCPLVPVPTSLTVVKGGVLARLVRSHPVAATVAIVVAGGSAAYANRPEPRPTAQPVVAASTAPTASAAPVASPAVSAIRSVAPSRKAKPTAEPAAVTCGRMPNPAEPNPAEPNPAAPGSRGRSTSRLSPAPPRRAGIGPRRRPRRTGRR